MSYHRGAKGHGYWCDECGGTLDPGEKCDCEKEDEKSIQPKNEKKPLSTLSA